MSRGPAGVRVLLCAGAVGIVHAAFSLYWALGGRWLLDTVGPWAVRMADRSAVQTGLALGLVAAAKLAGAVIPVLVETGRVPGRRVWRRLETLGAVVLLVYGLLNVVVSNLVLSSVVVPDGGYDRPAQLGHAALWDPLFALWGLLLLVGLRLTREIAQPVAR